MERLPKQEHARRGAALLQMTKSDGWAILVEEYEERLNAIRAKILDVKTPPEQTQSLKIVLKEMTQNSPSSLAQQLIKRSKANS